MKVFPFIEAVSTEATDPFLCPNPPPNFGELNRDEDLGGLLITRKAGLMLWWEDPDHHIPLTVLQFTDRLTEGDLNALL